MFTNQPQNSLVPSAVGKTRIPNTPFPYPHAITQSVSEIITDIEAGGSNAEIASTRLQLLLASKPELLPEIAQHIASTNKSVSKAVIKALPEAGPQSRVYGSTVAKLLNSSDSDVRIDAIFALRLLKHYEWGLEIRLMKRLESDNWIERASAAETLGAVSTQLDRKKRHWVVRNLKKTLYDNESSVQQSGMIAYERIGRDSRPAAPTVISLLDTTAFHVKTQGFATLGAISDAHDQVLPALISKVQTNDAYFAIRAMAQMHKSAQPAIPTLLELVTPENKNRKFASSAVVSAGVQETARVTEAINRIATVHLSALDPEEQLIGILLLKKLLPEAKIVQPKVQSLYGVSDSINQAILDFDSACRK